MLFTKVSKPLPLKIKAFLEPPKSAMSGEDRPPHPLLATTLVFAHKYNCRIG